MEFFLLNTFNSDKKEGFQIDTSRIICSNMKSVKFSTTEVANEMNSIYGYVKGSSCHMIHVKLLNLCDPDPYNLYMI